MNSIVTSITVARPYKGNYLSKSTTFEGHFSRKSMNKLQRCHQATFSVWWSKRGGLSAFLACYDLTWSSLQVKSDKVIY
jgi:hypothetical protein